MGRGFALAVALLVGSARLASAGHRVHVVTEPPGAHVYINDTESGAVCDATPCDIDPPYGESSLIVQLEKYAPDIEGIDVKRGGKTLNVSIKLKQAIATIVVDDPNAKGASIAVDGSDRGKVPARIDVDPGGHKLTVTLRGKALFDDFVDVETGDEKTIALAAPPPTRTAEAAKPEATKPEPTNSEPTKTVATTEDGAGSAQSNGEAHDEIVTVAEEPAHTRYVAASALVDFGFRRFQYVQPTGPLAPASTTALDVDFDSMVGAAFQVWPFELLGISALRELSLYGRFELPVTHLSVSNTTDAQTNSASYEISARYRQWLGGRSVAIDASFGYAEDQVTFSADSETLQMLPETDYSALRAGLGLVVSFGKVEAYAAIEGRDVLDGGELGARWQTSSIYGLGGLGGLAAAFGPIIARVQFEDLHYVWQFGNPVTAANGNAAGAIDKIFGITMFAGYQY